MEIQEQIKNIAQEFKNRMLNGEFEFIKADKHTATISIEGWFIDLWIANVIKEHLRVYGYNDITESIEGYIKFNTQKERLQIYKHLKEDIKKHKETVLKKEKEDKIKQLQKELEKLNK